MAKQYIDDIAVNTIVGQGSSVNGHINSAGFTKIDGDVAGNITSKGRIVVSQQARVKGNLRAKSVIVGGIIYGDIIAVDSVTLSTNAVVLGAIVTRHLYMEDNVLFSGFCYAVNDLAGFEDAERSYKNRRAMETATARYN
ncbi:MAG: polymer-forming cytoskeletal protein [Spirochaetaceae bacterium]|nr:polymer-forming cytoskeletal protein [Spirochaetaceae bacterium]